jgi:hypothetical protein
MLSNTAAAVAISAAIASGVAHAAAEVVQFYRPADPSLPWIAIFMIAGYAVALVAAVFAFVNKPAKPPGWRPTKPWAFVRVAPPAAYFGLLLVLFVLYQSSGSEVSPLIWKLGAGSGSQFAFALVVWEQCGCGRSSRGFGAKAARKT